MIMLFNNVHYYYLLGKGGYIYGGIGLPVCLSLCGQHCSKSYERTEMNFLGQSPG